MKFKNASLALVVVFCVATVSAQVTGSGTSHAIPVWTGTTTLGNSPIVSAGGNVAIGTTTPNGKLTVVSASTTANAVSGSANASSGYASGVYGSTASSTDFAAAVYGHAAATTGGAFGVYGDSESPNGTAVQGYAASTSAGATNGVAGFTNNGGNGVIGGANAPTGFSFGVQGYSLSSDGVGVQGSGPNVAVAGITQVCSPTCNLFAGTAGKFITGSGGLVLQGFAGSNFTQVFSVDSNGNLFITGNLTKGSGSFKIDDPLDPANKYLSHSFVESPDMMNIYNGVIVLDAKGEASVDLPDYFQALNSDFRYQLTAIGAPGPNLYVAEEISGNHFKVAGGKPGAKVSWQVTGVRQDAYAKAHRIKVEEVKPAQERGHYLHPELFGATEKEAIGAASVPAALPVTAADSNEAKLR
jgi:trimeric autotransporter adhesin